MVFTERTPGTIYGSVRDNKIIEGQKISTFEGHLAADGSNILNYKLGELIYNKNMEWRYSGSSKFLRTKRGSTLELDILFAALGSGVFYKDDTSYPFWVDTQGNLKYKNASGVIVTLQTGLDTTYRHEFWFYGLAGNETLYGANRNDGIYKITLVASVFTYTSVLSSVGAWSISYSKISGRLFFVNGHKSYYGKIQNQTSLDTSNLEFFDVDNQWLWVNPDQGDGILRIIDNGDVTFYFKDTGIWALINAEEEIANWLQPQCNADVGTKSPDSVRYVKYGQQEAFIYLGTDKTLRLFNAQVQRNSGARPTLEGGDSLIISTPFQKLLLDIPDSQIGKCVGYFFQNYYIFVFVSESGFDLDSAIILDLDKLLDARESDNVNQPYWFYVDNMEFTSFYIEDNRKLFGMHKSGYIAELLINNKYYEEVPARITPNQDFRDYIVITTIAGTFVNNETITGGSSGATGTTTLEISSNDLLIKNVSGTWTIGETITGSKSGATATIVSIVRRVAIEWAAYTGWHKFSAREARLYDAYINWNVQGRWNVNFSVNSFILGESIPGYDEGIVYPINADSLGGSYFDFSFFNIDRFSYRRGQAAQNTGGQGRGHYFSFGFFNNNYDEWATIFSIEPRFEVIKNDSIGRNF